MGWSGCIEGHRHGRAADAGPGLVGYMASFGALAGTSGIEDTCERLPSLLRPRRVESGMSFEDGLRRSVGVGAV